VLEQYEEFRISFTSEQLHQRDKFTEDKVQLQCSKLLKSADALAEAYRICLFNATEELEQKKIECSKECASAKKAENQSSAKTKLLATLRGELGLLSDELGLSKATNKLLQEQVISKISIINSLVFRFFEKNFVSLICTP